LSAGAEKLQDNQDFRAETADILTALTVVKDLGINRPLAVTIDPQLEVEAMIDPNAHALAVSYYGINDQWAYWKSQLLQGEPRHAITPSTALPDTTRTSRCKCCPSGRARSQ